MTEEAQQAQEAQEVQEVQEVQETQVTQQTQSDDKLELILDLLEDLSQEVDALRADARYIMFSGIEELEEQARRRRVTLEARAHFERRPDLSLEDPDRRHPEEMVPDSEYRANG